MKWLHSLAGDPARVWCRVHPQLCELLRNLGYSFQKAHLVSDYLDEARCQAWLNEEWSRILKEAVSQGADYVRRRVQLCPMEVVELYLDPPGATNRWSRRVANARVTRYWA